MKRLVTESFEWFECSTGDRQLRLLSTAMTPYVRGLTAVKYEVDDPRDAWGEGHVGFVVRCGWKVSSE